MLIGTAVCGKPHVRWCERVDGVKRPSLYFNSLDLNKIGKDFEYHPLFPERVNTEFVKVIDRTNLDMRVYERGSGETFACGTGACAAAVSSVINGYCDYDTPIGVSLIGGTLTIVVDRDLNVKMTGPATKVYDGVFAYECETE